MKPIIANPLGRVAVHVPTKKGWEKLTEACEKHECDFEWDNGNEPTKHEEWDDEKEKSCIAFGYKDFYDTDENKIKYGVKKGYEKKNFPIITLGEALKLLAEPAQEILEVTELKGSPLDRVAVHIPTKKEWVELMKACEKCKFKLRWRKGNRPTGYSNWSEYAEETCVVFGYKEYGILAQEKKRILVRDRFPVITFEEAIKRLSD